MFLHEKKLLLLKAVHLHFKEKQLFQTSKLLRTYVSNAQTSSKLLPEDNLMRHATALSMKRLYSHGTNALIWPTNNFFYPIGLNYLRQFTCISRKNNYFKHQSYSEHTYRTRRPHPNYYPKTTWCAARLLFQWNVYTAMVLMHLFDLQIIFLSYRIESQSH